MIPASEAMTCTAGHNCSSCHEDEFSWSRQFPIIHRNGRAERLSNASPAGACPAYAGLDQSAVLAAMAGRACTRCYCNHAEIPGLDPASAVFCPFGSAKLPSIASLGSHPARP
jgi:hypothetical protein